MMIFAILLVGFVLFLIASSYVQYEGKWNKRGIAWWELAAALICVFLTPMIAIMLIIAAFIWYNLQIWYGNMMPPSWYNKIYRWFAKHIIIPLNKRFRL